MDFGGSTTISQWSKQHRISQNKELFWWSRKQELFSIIWSASGQYSLRCPLRYISKFQMITDLFSQVFQVFDCTASLHVADNSKLFSTLMLNKMYLLACLYQGWRVCLNEIHSPSFSPVAPFSAPCPAPLGEAACTLDENMLLVKLYCWNPFFQYVWFVESLAICLCAVSLCLCFNLLYPTQLPSTNVLSCIISEPN